MNQNRFEEIDRTQKSQLDNWQFVEEQTNRIDEQRLSQMRYPEISKRDIIKNWGTNVIAYTDSPDLLDQDNALMIMPYGAGGVISLEQRFDAYATDESGVLLRQGSLGSVTWDYLCIPFSYFDQFDLAREGESLDPSIKRAVAAFSALTNLIEDAELDLVPLCLTHYSDAWHTLEDDKRRNLVRTWDEMKQTYRKLRKGEAGEQVLASDPFTNNLLPVRAHCKADPPGVIRDQSLVSDVSYGKKLMRKTIDYTYDGAFVSSAVKDYLRGY